MSHVGQSGSLFFNIYIFLYLKLIYVRENERAQLFKFVFLIIIT